MDFSYLVTAWSSESVPDRAQDEHRLLGEVMQTLLRHRTIPEDVLQGVLANQDPPLPASALQPGRLQSLGEFWQALGGKPKAALNYSVTVSIDVSVPEDVRLVTDKVLKIRALQGERMSDDWGEWEVVRRQVAVCGRMRPATGRHRRGARRSDTGPSTTASVRHDGIYFCPGPAGWGVHGDSRGGRGRVFGGRDRACLVECGGRRHVCRRRYRAILLEALAAAVDREGDTHSSR